MNGEVGGQAGSDGAKHAKASPGDRFAALGKLSEVPFEEFVRLREFLLANANAPDEIADELGERFGLTPGD